MEGLSRFFPALPKTTLRSFAPDGAFFFSTEKLNSDEMIIKLLGATGSRRQMEAPLTQESLD